MNIDQADNIRRLAGGNIDYGYYSTRGRQARARGFRTIARVMLAGSKRSARGLLPAMAAIVSVLTF